jgi:hypothetical protein
MAHYAFLNDNNIVTEVITGKDETDTDTLPEGFDSWEAWYSDFRGQTCKRTSYNTFANAHSGDGTPFRGNYAGIGHTYDATNDVFIEPKPYESWTLNEDTWTWKAPVDKPDLTEEQEAAGSVYVWNEDTTSWDLITP